MMEVLAGFLSHTGHHLGRVIDFLKETGQFDNTLIMLVSDNGASAEGGVHGTSNELQFFNNAGACSGGAFRRCTTRFVVGCARAVGLACGHCRRAGLG